MPFLNWFKSKSERREAVPKSALAENSSPEPSNLPTTNPWDSQIDTLSETPPIEEQTALAPTAPDSAPVSPEPAAGETKEPWATPQLSVPIGAFYAKVPAHLLAPKKPDLARLVQIAAEDLVVDDLAREATAPLSILSLSCPEIFAHPIDSPDDIPITFPFAEDERAEIKVRLQPVLSNFPPGLELPSIGALSESEAEIALPLDLIRSQLASGRVVIPAAMFCAALPSELKPAFHGLEPTAEIPIPLQEIFLGLPSEAIKLREDQEVDFPRETIRTPFSVQAEEDAIRFAHVSGELTLPAASMLSVGQQAPAPAEPANPLTLGPDSSPSDLKGDVVGPNVSSAPLLSMPEFPAKIDSERLQAIFMTEESLDLPKTIDKLGRLPGLRACLLSTDDGRELAGNLGDSSKEKAILALLPGLFKQVSLSTASMQFDALETITLYCGRDQLSTFMQGRLCLTVLHDNRPFKPGVREKVQAVINELVALSRADKAF